MDLDLLELPFAFLSAFATLFLGSFFSFFGYFGTYKVSIVFDMILNPPDTALLKSGISAGLSSYPFDCWLENFLNIFLPISGLKFLAALPGNVLKPLLPLLKPLKLF